jgi:peptidoglycan/LPS O-acetylase OafA/YrhL
MSSAVIERQGLDATREPTTAAASLGPARLRRGRLEFLDALRGIAAMSVALQHGAELLWPSYLRWSVEVFRPGEFGVFVFFMCSGFIIPASLEKYGELRRFWTGRVFRLYPLYWFVLAVVVVAGLVFAVYPMDPRAVAPRGLLLNVTMVQDFSGLPNIIGAAWTLAFEMCFYIACSILFLAGLQQRSAAVALPLLAAGAFTGLLVPSVILGTHTLASYLVVAAWTVAVAAAAAWLTRHRGRRAQVVAIGLSAVLVPLVLNRNESWWFAMMMFGTMFTGTVLYRWHRGQVSLRLAAIVLACAVAAMLIGSVLNVEDRIDPSVANAHHTWRPEFATYLAAIALFAAALALRHLSFPRLLIYLGTISYSIYLVHAAAIHVIPRLPHPVLTYALWMAVVVAVSMITYHLIEKPFQDLGHRLARRPRPD